MQEEKGDRSRVKKCSGTYSFQIDGYSGLPARVSECVESPEFLLCGHKWQLRIFPGGSLEAHKGYVSFYLASKSNRIARASYRLSVLNHIPGLDDEGFSSTAVRTFEPKGDQVDGWGRDKFMDASLLDDPDFGFRVLDVVTFKVEMTVYGELEYTTVTETELTQRAANYSLEHSMYQLLQHPTHSDVHFVVGAERVVIAAHKCILMARSAVFYAMFSHEMNEELAGEIVVPDVEVTVMREMLNFLYTGQRTAAEVSQGDLFRVAVKYQLPGLIAQCEEHFIAQLSVDTAVPLLEMADTFGAQQLKIRCMQFIAQHAASITSQSAYQDLDELLLRDVNRLIDAGHKRHRWSGGGSQPMDRERKFRNTCVIM